MFLTLIKQRVQHKKVSMFCLILALAVSSFCLHSFVLLYRNVSQGYVSHSQLTDLIVGPSQSFSTAFNESLLFNEMPSKLITQPQAVSNPTVDRFAPLIFGEVFRGRTVVATTADLFKMMKQKKTLFKGRSEFGGHSVIIGKTVYKDSGIDIGDDLHFSHAHHTGHADAEHDAHGFHVTGVLEETGTALDSLIFISTEGYSNLHGEVAPNQAHYYWVTAKKPIFAMSLANVFNKEKGIQAYSPKFAQKAFVLEVNKTKTLIYFACFCLLAVMLIQGFTVFFFLLKQYIHEVKVLILCGASYWYVFSTVFVECFFYGVVGLAVGIGSSSLALSQLSGMFSSWIDFPIVSTAVSVSQYLITALLMGLLLFLCIQVLMLGITRKRHFLRI